MKATVSPVYLQNIERDELEAAELWDAITEQHLSDWEDEWVPELSKALQRLQASGVEPHLWPQDRDWDWRKKTQLLRGTLAHPAYSIVCSGMTQGMMIVNTAMKPCRVDSQKGKYLVYVEYVESAPWNRRDLFYPPRYHGVGTTLIRTAIELSKDLEFHGRIGLHSLPQASEFYADSCGMTCLGVDRKYNLPYFEMTPESGQAFIEKAGDVL